MKEIIGHTGSAAIFILAICIFSLPAVANDDLFWRNASTEVDSFPFTQAFIDSVKNEHGVTRPSQPLRRVKSGPFVSGEKMVYEVTWGLFKAGYLIIEAQPHEATNTIRISAKALSNNFVSAFYRVRDYVISWVDADGLYPIFFEQHLRERNYVSDGYIAYDPLQNRVFIEGRRSVVIEETPSVVHDYLSILYKVRSMDLKRGSNHTLDLLMSREVNPITFRIRKGGEINSTLGKFNTIRIEPQLVGEGRAFNRRDQMEIWVTDDEHKIPIQIRSKVGFGSLTARIVHYERIPGVRPDQTGVVCSSSQLR